MPTEVARLDWPAEKAALDRLAAEITELGAHIHAATARWLLLIADFDRRKGWADWDCKSCADWLSWRCGLSPVAAKQHVRVAARLAEMPLIQAAFESGELSYSKVRALARVATPANEEELLGIARNTTAAQVEALVRTYRRVRRIEESEDARATHARRYLNYHFDDEGCLLIRARLSPDDGAVVARALEAARSGLAPDADSAESPEARLDDDITRDSAEAAAHSWEEAWSDGDEDVADRDSAESVLDACGETGRVPRRNADALVVMAETLLEAGPTARSGGERYQVVVHVDAQTLVADDGDRCHLEQGPSLAAETARRLGCDASVIALVEKDGEPLSVGRKRRSVSASIKRALAARDRGCRFPGCTNKRFVDAHHIEHWIRGGETKLRNLVQLCRFHHRLVHEYGYEVELDGTKVRFRRPDGSVVADLPPPVPPTRDVGALNREQGLSIDAETCVTGWDGATMDVSIAVDGLLWWDRNPTYGGPTWWRPGRPADDDGASEPPAAGPS